MLLDCCRTVAASNMDCGGRLCCLNAANIYLVAPGLCHEPNASNKAQNGLRMGELWVLGRFTVIGVTVQVNSNQVIIVHGTIIPKKFFFSSLFSDQGFFISFLF